MWLVLPAVAGLAAPALAAGKKADAPSPTDLRTEMRRLWEEHVTYTAFFYKAALAGSEDAGPIAERLLRNQDEIGNAIKPFYGEDAGNKLAALLRDHILVAADLVKAAKAGDAAAQKAANERWYRNSEDIAVLLSGANPNWPRETIHHALDMHLELVTQQVVAALKKDYAGEIAAYDKGVEHMLALADTLSAGIVKQFPKRFHKV
jgi:hypothetical protein